MTTLDEYPADRLGGGRVERPVERDDAAKGADRVASERLIPGFAQARADRDAARVGVLDDRHRRRSEFGDQLEGGVGIGIVVVRQLLALELARGRHAGAALAGAVERARLMRVLAVAQRLGQPAGNDQRFGECLAFLARHPFGDRRIVGGGAPHRPCAASRRRSPRLTAPPRLEFGEHVGRNRPDR